VLNLLLTARELTGNEWPARTLWKWRQIYSKNLECHAQIPGVPSKSSVIMLSCLERWLSFRNCVIPVGSGTISRWTLPEPVCRTLSCGRVQIANIVNSWASLWKSHTHHVREEVRMRTTFYDVALTSRIRLALQWSKHFICFVFSFAYLNVLAGHLLHAE
jgi:hypothetical protein